MEHPMPKLTSLNVSLPEDLKEFVRQEVAEGGYSTPSDFVRTVLRERREQNYGGGSTRPSWQASRHRQKR